MKGLFGRGLSTRLLTNMLQSMVFSVGWKARWEAAPRSCGPPCREQALRRGPRRASYLSALATAGD